MHYQTYTLLLSICTFSLILLHATPTLTTHTRFLHTYTYSMAAYLVSYQTGVNRIWPYVSFTIFLTSFVFMQLCIVFYVVFMAFGGVYVAGEGWGLEVLLLLVDLMVVQPRVYLALKVYCWVVLVVARGGENWGGVEFAFK